MASINVSFSKDNENVESQQGSQIPLASAGTLTDFLDYRASAQKVDSVHKY